MRYDDIYYFLEKGHNVAEIASFLEKYNLPCFEMSFGPGWQYTNGEIKKQTLTKAERTFRGCKALGCDCAVACASAESGDTKQAIKDYQKLCMMGNDYGVRLGLEFLGFAKQIKDLKTAWEIVQRADVSNGGIILDTFHFYRGRSNLTDLQHIPIEKILIVHMNDAPNIALDKLKDSHRVSPHKGIIPLHGILQVIYRREYQGYFSLELLNPIYWEDDPHKIAQVGIGAIQNLLQQVQS